VRLNCVKATNINYCPFVTQKLPDYIHPATNTPAVLDFEGVDEVKAPGAQLLANLQLSDILTIFCHDGLYTHALLPAEPMYSHG
jgi:hypothetical protein